MKIRGNSMAKLEKRLFGNFDQWIGKIEEGILNGSKSASLEEYSDLFICNYNRRKSGGFL